MTLAKMPVRLGILGGTFDPVHMGHLRIAEEAVDQLRLDGLMFIPAASPPHKFDRTLQSYQHRCAMLEIAIADNPRFSLSTIEQELPGRSYTVVTLKKLRADSSRCVEYYFLVGMDGFLELDTWWRYKELFQLARIVVLERPGYSVDDVLETLKRMISPLFEAGDDSSTFVHPHLFPVHALKSTLLDISSTGIRQLLAAGRSIRYLAPSGVLGYISAHALYRPPEEAAHAASGGHPAI